MPINKGMPVFGSFIVEQPNISTIEIAASAGADFLILDGEHGPMDLVPVRNAVAAARSLQVDTLVRIPNVESGLLSHSLDAGARGIVIANVQSAKEAQRAVQRVKFPPVGERGAAFGSAMDGYSSGDVASKIAQANLQTMILCMIESPAGLSQADEIASIEGIDGLWFGYIDFSIAAGVPGLIEHQKVLDAAGQIAMACRQQGKRAGVMVTSGAGLVRYVEHGYDIIAFGSDAFVLKQGFLAGFEVCRTAFVNTVAMGC
jgi:2-dehydro-3-deoxyglucarate aldolase/4-hydroxy-2-oxoheptanedioate aldolase